MFCNTVQSDGQLRSQCTLKEKSSGILYLLTAKKTHEKTSKTHHEVILLTGVVSVAYSSVQQTSKNTSVSHNVTLGVMFLHYDEHGHCSLF